MGRRSGGEKGKQMKEKRGNRGPNSGRLFKASACSWVGAALIKDASSEQDTDAQGGGTPHFYENNFGSYRWSNLFHQDVITRHQHLPVIPWLWSCNPINHLFFQPGKHSGSFPCGCLLHLSLCIFHRWSSFPPRPPNPCILEIPTPVSGLDRADKKKKKTPITCSPGRAAHCSLTQPPLLHKCVWQPPNTWGLDVNMFFEGFFF